MKRGKVLMAVLVVLAVLFASCSSGLSKDAEGEGGSSTKTVSVTFGVDIEGTVQKVVSGDDVLTGLTYYYKATPTWRGDAGVTRKIAGDTNDEFVQIPGYSSGNSANLGYFTAGTWNFEVEVRKDAKVVFEGNTTEAIYESHTGVTVIVTPKTDGGNGFVTFTVKVPTTGANEVLKMSYDGGANWTSMTPSGDTPNGLRTFTYAALDQATGTGITPGPYTFTFLYYDQAQAAKAENERVSNGGASVALNVFAGQESSISGLIENGLWHSGTITIKQPEFTTFTLSAADDATSVAPQTNLVYTMNAVSYTGHTNTDLTYAWYVNGVRKQQSTAKQYTFASEANAYGMYDVTCVVTDGTKITQSATLYVAVGHLIKKAAMTNGAVGSRTYAAAGETITLTPAPAEGYSLDGTPTVTDATSANVPTTPTAAGGSYTFTMPAKDVTVSATFTN